MTTTPPDDSIYNAPSFKFKGTPITLPNGRSLFHLRFDHRKDDEPPRVVSWLKTTHAYDILLVSEVSDVVGKIHYHCLLDESRALRTVREQFQNRFNFDGDANEYSFVPARGVKNDFETVERYLCKGSERGTYNVIYKCGKWDDELIALRNTQYWDINDQVQLARQMKPLGTINSLGSGTTRVIIHDIETKKRKSRSFIADVVERIQSEVALLTKDDVDFDGTNALEANRIKAFEWFHPRHVKSHSDFVLTVLLKMHGQNFKPYGDAQIENEYNAIVQILAPEKQMKHMKDRLKHRNNILC